MENMPRPEGENNIRKLTKDIEAFNPEEYLEEERRARKHRRLVRLIVLIVCLLVLGGGAYAAYGYYQKLTTRTSEFFAASETPEPSVMQKPDRKNRETPTPAPTATPDPFAATAEKLPVPEDNILNILLIGVDYAEERERWGGKDGISAAHADVMIVLAVNFTRECATLISLPRDTYTYIPGVSGIYKLNGALNCGGGMFAEGGAGFKKCCEAASYLLGGQPVEYYYAVTMPAVKQLVNAIGGVDYRVEVDFTLNGRHYGKGRQHMNGQAVLDYLRVRKAGSGLQPGQTGDVNRVNRQKKMLIAIFDQLKKGGTILKVPEILDAFEGQLFTNCTTEQTAALALYGSNMTSSNIAMASMTGKMHSLYRWNFNFIDQGERIDLIRRVYGVTVPALDEIGYNNALIVQQTNLANQAINTCGPLTEYLNGLKARSDAAVREEDVFTETQENYYNSYMSKLEKCKELRSTPSTNKLKNACSALENVANKCKSIFGYGGEFVWTVPTLADMNEVYVDFR